MASTEQLPSGRWRPIARDSAGKKIPKLGTYRLKSDAQHVADEAEVRARRRASLAKGTLPATTTWGQWWEIVADGRVFESDRAYVEKSIVDNHITPRWGTVPLNEIGKKAVQKWVNTLAAAHSPSYVRSIYGVFRVSVNAAIDEDPPVLNASPCVGVKLPKVPRKAEAFVAPDESVTLAQHLAQEFADAEEFAYETGLRPGELAGLHDDQVDPAGWLTVRTVYVLRAGRMRDRPKDEDVRVVPLTTKALGIYQRRVKDRAMRQPCGVAHYGKRRCQSDLVFRTAGGAVLDQQTFRDALEAACRKAKLPNRSPYALRRGYGTRLGRAGVDAFELAELMGHSDVSETRKYVQQSAGVRDRVLAALGDPTATGLRVVGQQDEHGTDRGTPPAKEPPAAVRNGSHREAQ